MSLLGDVGRDFLKMRTSFEKSSGKTDDAPVFLNMRTSFERNAGKTDAKLVYGGHPACWAGYHTLPSSPPLQHPPQQTPTLADTPPPFPDWTGKLTTGPVGLPRVFDLLFSHNMGLTMPSF